MKKRLPGRASENGFTLVELLIVVVIVGVLAAIAIPSYLNQQRSASVATLRQDIADSITALRQNVPDGSDFPTESVFLGNATQSRGNTLGLVVSGSPAVACIYGYHTFSSTDKVYYHYMSDTGRTYTGDCAAGNTDSVGGNASPAAVVSSSPATPSQTPPPASSPSASPSASAGVTQMAKVDFKVTYNPQTNRLSFCYKVDVSTTSSSPITWQYKIDISQAPFYGAQPGSYDSTYGYATQGLNGNIWTFGGASYNSTVVAGNATSIGFCASNVPEPPIDSTLFTVATTVANGAGPYYACVNIVPSTTDGYPIPWSTTVDLHKYFKNFEANPVQISNRLTVTPLGNYVYTVSGVAGDTRYISATNTQSITSAFCVNANGQAWQAQ